MFLPTFWKLTAEATMYRGRHMAGYAVPVGFMGKHTFRFKQIQLFGSCIHLSITGYSQASFLPPEVFPRETKLDVSQITWSKQATYFIMG